MARRAFGRLAIALALALGLPVAVAVPARGSAALPSREPAMTLTVAPVSSAERGTLVSVVASVNNANGSGDVLFYDGSRVVAVKAWSGPIHAVLWETRSLKSGPHRLRAALFLTGRSQAVARTQTVAYTITPSPTADDQSLVVHVPRHPVVRVEPIREQRAPTGRAAPVQGASEGRGALAMTGVAVLGLLLLAVTLLAAGSAARVGARVRARRALRFLGAAMTVVGAAGASLIYVGTVGSSEAATGTRSDAGAVGPTGAPGSSQTDPPAWPDTLPPPTLTVIDPTGTPLTPPIATDAGARLTIVASGFDAGDLVLVQLGGLGRGPQHAVADRAGTVRFRLVVPASAATGLHTITLAGGPLVSGVALTVDDQRGG